MKKLLTTSLIAIFLFIPLFFSLAQELENDIPNDIDVQILEEIEEDDQEQLEEEESLLDTLETETTQEDQIQPPTRDYWTILGAILIPSVFIIVCYFILKAFETK